MIGLILYISNNGSKPELYGQGCHGYLYTTELSKTKHKKPDGYILTSKGYALSKSKDDKDNAYFLDVYPLFYFNTNFICLIISARICQIKICFINRNLLYFLTKEINYFNHLFKKIQGTKIQNLIFHSYFYLGRSSFISLA